MSIGFKEWTLVCDELGGGRQSIILRKGGIAEGRDGFRFQHPDFLLFPTLFHEQLSKLKLPEATILPNLSHSEHTLRNRVVVEWTRDLTDWQQVRALDALHCWREDVIRERFEYDSRMAVSLAFVRVYRLEQPFTFPDAPKYGGCRSWVNLPELPSESSASHPVLDEVRHREVEARVRAALGGLPASGH